MTQRESRLSQKIQRALRDVGVFCFKVHGSAHMMAGLPDIVCCVDGYFVAFEVKVPGEEHDVSPRQEFVHHLIQHARGQVYVVSSVRQTLAIIEDIAARGAIRRAMTESPTKSLIDEHELVHRSRRRCPAGDARNIQD